MVLIGLTLLAGTQKRVLGSEDYVKVMELFQAPIPDKAGAWSHGGSPAGFKVLPASAAQENVVSTEGNLIV